MPRVRVSRQRSTGCRVLREQQPSCLSSRDRGGDTPAAARLGGSGAVLMTAAIHDELSRTTPSTPCAGGRRPTPCSASPGACTSRTGRGASRWTWPPCRLPAGWAPRSRGCGRWRIALPPLECAEPGELNLLPGGHGTPNLGQGGGDRGLDLRAGQVGRGGHGVDQLSTVHAFLHGGQRSIPVIVARPGQVGAATCPKS